jgi:hypothetical protein
MQSSLLILRQHINIPDRFEKVKMEVQLKEIKVLTAMIDLIGRQFIHLKTYGGWLKRTISAIFTDTNDLYNMATQQLAESLTEFNRSLQTATFEMVSSK